MNNNNMDPYSAGGQMPSSPQLAPLPSGNDPAVLEQIKGLNWGAFLLSWLWTWNNIGAMWGIIHFIVLCIPGVNLISQLFLLIKGNELAWTYRHFNSVEEFRAVQAAWVKYGLIVLGVTILLYIFIMVAMGFIFAGAASQMGSV